MKYTEEMILHSSSGYCMPFEEKNGCDVQMISSYGKHKRPGTNDTYFNHGVDFNAKGYLLAAVASGIVSSIGSDKKIGVYQTIRYGNYEVTYSNLSNFLVTFGEKVYAGQAVAISNDSLHLEVKFKGEELNPIEFLTMLYGNIKALEKSSPNGTQEFMTFDMNIPTKFDKDQKEIEELLLRFFPFYMEDLQEGAYSLPKHTEQSLRNIFTIGSTKKYFFETMPNLSNPMGLSNRAMPMACKVQNLLIADFLNYLAIRHNVYLSNMNDALKKNFMKKQ